MSWFTRQQSITQKRRHTTLAVEKFEDRCLMSGTPMQASLPEAPAMVSTQQAGAGTPSDADVETIIAGGTVEAKRSWMKSVASGSYSDMNEIFKITPVAAIWKGHLVIYGSHSKDIVHVQENPVTNAKDPNSNSWIVKIDGHRPYKDSFPRGQVTTVVFFGEGYLGYGHGVGGDDTFTFISLDKKSKTQIYADGQKGADTLNGGPNADFLDGGVGDALKNKLTGGAGDDVLAGGLGPDDLWGKAGNDLLWGEAGDDNLRGENDIDQLFGGEDNDELQGGPQKDYLYGGNGQDYLVGGVGDTDELWGEKGADRFAIDGSLKANKDKPKDYKPAENDTYWLGGKQVSTATLLGMETVDVPGKPKKK